MTVDALFFLVFLYSVCCLWLDSVVFKHFKPRTSEMVDSIAIMHFSLQIKTILLSIDIFL